MQPTPNTLARIATLSPTRAQDEVTNPRLVTFYMLAALASLYALLTQLNLYR
jgi:hypothetical protein